MRPFHFCRTSSVKNSDVFMGANEVSYWKRVSFWGTIVHVLVLPLSSPGTDAEG